ncbi:proteoglycan 4-like [Physella acuta]|uniref:proteoglycan 4-like n=1 Tax=Physella acuta TaxID=109671 RepID=UPI0027DE040E|nr:proteoglycan 4-like [Physella acuta]XP_059165545.1 proteoglycan 4-like [Physella acuta]
MTVVSSRSSRVCAGVSRWQELSFYLVVLAQVLSIVNGSSPLPCGGVKGRYICDDEDPQVFHICMGNNKYTHRCPGDLHYNVRTQNCDWPKAVNCVEEARQRALQKRLDVEPDAPSKFHDTAKKPQAKTQDSPVPDKQAVPRSTSRPQDKSPLPTQVNQAVRHKDSNEYSGKFDKKGEQLSDASLEVTRKPEVSTRSFTYQVESESGSIDYTDEPDFSEENRIQRIRFSDRIVQPYKATAAPKTSTTTRKTTPTSTTTKPTTTRPLNRSPTTVSRSPFKKPTVAYHPVQNTRSRTEQREFAPQNPVESIKPKTTRKPKNDDRWDPLIESAPYKSATNFDDDITSVPKWYETTADDSANRLDDGKMSTRAYSKPRQEAYRERPAKKTEDSAEKEFVPSWVKSNQVKSQVAKSIPISVAHSHNVVQQKVQTTKETPTPTPTTAATFQRARTTLKKFKPRPTEIEDVARTFTTVKTALKEKFSQKKEGKLWYEEETAKVESTSKPEVKEQKDETVQNIVFSRRPVTNSRFSRKTEPAVTSSRPDVKETTKDAVIVTKEKITQRPSYSAAASTVSKSPFAPFNRQVVGRTSQKPSDETFSQKSTRAMSSQRPSDDKPNQKSNDEKSKPRLNEENPKQKSKDESSPQRQNDEKSYLISAEDKSSPTSREVDSEKPGKSLPWWSKDQLRTSSHSGHADQPKSSRRAYIPAHHNTQKPNYHTRTPKFDIELVPSNQGGAEDETSARRFTPRHKVQDTSKEVDRSFSLHQVNEAASADRRFALHKAYNPPNQAAAAEDRKFALHKAQNSATNPYSAAAAVDKRPETQQQQASPSRVNAPAALDKFSVGLIKEDPKHVNREVKEQSQYKSPIEKYDYKKGKCSSTWCKLPDCRCIGSDVPGDLDPKDIPQLVMLTFDDSINGQNMGYYKTIFNGTLKNPNGCPIKSTFFVSGDNSDYEMVRKIHKGGHEIASHTLSHRSPTTWWADAGFENWEQEVVGMKKRLHEKSGIPLDGIVGMRAPFLQVGGDAQYAMLKENRFRYDTSMVTGNLYVNNEAPTWPFTLDTPPDSKTCSLTPCPTRSYPGLWEVPLIRWYGNNRIACAMPDACTIGAGTKGSRKFIEDNFMRHYTTNRAPFGIFIHASWFARKDGNLEGLVEFLGSLADKDDVWVVTVNQALDWIQRPVRLSAISAMDSWMC